MDHSIIDAFLAKPEAPLLLEKINQALANEKNKREEFYHQISDQEKAEFINGEVIMHSPASKLHGDILKNLSRIITFYVDHHNLGWVGVEKMMISLSRNDYEPDLIFFKSERSYEFKSSQMKFPAPDFIVEILSNSTKVRDRGIKFSDYAAHGIKEYWIIDPEMSSVEKYYLINEDFELQIKIKEGVIQSHEIKGLELPVEALFDEKMSLEVVKKFLT